MKLAGELAWDSTRRTIAERLRTLRLSMGKTQIDIANETGISTTAWNNYERGRARISFENLRKLCQTYRGVTSDWILFGEKPRDSRTAKRRIAREERESA
jgi:transcriptional regulator with XRE-family HTH domain